MMTCKPLSIVRIRSLDAHARRNWLREHPQLPVTLCAKRHAANPCALVVWRRHRAQASRLEIDIGAPGDLFAEAVRAGLICRFRISATRKLRRAFRRISPPPFRRLPASSSSDVPETGPISSEDIGLLRAVRGQIILAMKTVR